MIIYHGTIDICAENIKKNGILLSKGKVKVDFGQGFYTTPDFNFAKNTAKHKRDKTNLYNYPNYCKACVLSFEYNTNLEREMGLNKLVFQKKTEKWAQFIINNRNGIEYINSVKLGNHNTNQKYDIVVGAIADNSIVNIAYELKKSNKSITKEELVNIEYKYKTSQISFHTIESLNCIELIDCVIID